MYSPEFLTSTKSALRLLTSYKKRQFVAQIATDFFDSSPRKMETYLGVKRKMVELALKEQQSGFICLSNFSLRGRKKKNTNSSI
jgi:hypothetical protein